MQYDYPAIFYDDDNSVAFHFYDAENWFSCGDNIADALTMAQDVLGGQLLNMERTGEKIPPATPLEKVMLKPFQVVRMIHVDTTQYAKEFEELKRREAALLAENPVKFLREQTGLSIRQFAEELGVPYRTAQDWNAGISKPPKWAVPLLVDKFLK